MDEKSGDSKNMSPQNNHDPSENSSENVDEADLQGKKHNLLSLQKTNHKNLVPHRNGGSEQQP